MFGRPGNGGGNNRTICKFFLEGRCKFGDNCKNEHPRSQQQQQQQQSNRFAPLQNAANSGFRGQSGNSGSEQARPRNLSVDSRRLVLQGTDSVRHFANCNMILKGNRDSNPFSVTEDGIRDDLTTGKERPQWPLSAYGPGIQAPRQLLEGAIEVSPEEMRVLCYLAQASGNPQQYVQHEEKLTQQMNQQIHAVLRDLPGARKYINDGQNQHPNRNDITESAPQSSSRQDAPAQTTSGFGGGGGGGGGAASGFGAPSNLGAPRTAFGAPTAMGQNTAFGAPSSLAPGSAFGKPAALGGGVGAFGQPSNLNQSSAFGQSSTGFGNNQQTTPFGQGAKPSPFGQPSALGQTTGFGAQSRQPQQATAFGQPTAFGAASQGQSPFAQAASNQTNASPFAQAASNRTNASPFAQATSGQTNASPFAQAASSQTANNSPFGQPIQNQASAPSVFGRPSQPQAASQSPFASANNSQQAFGFGTAKPPAPRPTAAPASSFASASNRQNANIITGEDGNSYYEVAAPTRENPSNRQRERIWHPKGPPENTNLDAQGPDEVYTGELGTALEEIYKAVMQTGKFTEAGGLMPEIPPKRDWIGWDM